MLVYYNNKGTTMSILVLPSMPINFLLELLMKSELTVKLEKLGYLYAKVILKSALKANECIICLDDELFNQFKKDLDLNITNLDLSNLKYSDFANSQLLLLYKDSNTTHILITRVTFIKD